MHGLVNVHIKVNAFLTRYQFSFKSFGSHILHCSEETVFGYRIPHPSTLWFHPTSVISHLEGPILGHYHDFNFLNYRNFLFTIDSPCFSAWCNIPSDVTWKSMAEVPIVPLHLPLNFMSQNDSAEIKYKIYFRKNQLSCRIICLELSLSVSKGNIELFHYITLYVSRIFVKLADRVLFCQCFHDN